MLREVVALVPHQITDQPARMFVAAAGAGALLALAGGRFSRSLVTLCVVALGAFLGLHFPAWMGWSLDAIGAAFCGAIVLGLSGFVLHRLWIGLLLATLLGSSTGLMTWIARSAGVQWNLPAIDVSQAAPDMLAAVWRSLPPALFPILPVAVGIAIGVGILLGCLTPRLARVTLFSILGVAIFAIAGTIATQRLWPQTYDALPTKPFIELAAFLGLVTITCGIQWLVLPKTARRKSPASQKADDDSIDDRQIAAVPAPSFATSAAAFDQKR